MAKSMTVEATIEFLMAPGPREGAFLSLFKAADPSEEANYPAMLTECGRLLDQAAEELRRRGEPADAHRRDRDALYCAAVAELILSIEDRAARFRLQDIDEPGLARLIALASWIAPRAKSSKPIAEALRDLLPGIYTYIDQVSPLEDGDDGAR